MLKKKKFIIKEEEEQQQNVNDDQNNEDQKTSDNSNNDQKTEDQKTSDSNNKENSSEQDSSDKEQKTDEKEQQDSVPENIRKNLEQLGFKEDPNKKGVFVNEKYTDKLSVGITFNESCSEFNKIYRNIILEESGEQTCTLVYKTDKMDEQKPITDFKLPEDIDADKTKEAINNAIKDDITQTAKDEFDVDTQILIDSFKKLDENEQLGLIEFYGRFNKDNKVYKFLTELKEKIEQEG